VCLRRRSLYDQHLGWLMCLALLLQNTSVLTFDIHIVYFLSQVVLLYSFFTLCICKHLSVFASSLHDQHLGWLMCFAVSLHNIPEGIVIATPVYAATRYVVRVIDYISFCSRFVCLNMFVIATLVYAATRYVAHVIDNMLIILFSAFVVVSYSSISLRAHQFNDVSLHHMHE
jgi:zinc transporter ZupT